MPWIERFLENNFTVEGVIITLISIVIWVFIILALTQDCSDDDFDIMG